MRCERTAGLGRYLVSLNKPTSDTFVAQWFISFSRRHPHHPGQHSVRYPQRIKSRLMEEPPFMATENIIMKLVSLGKSRQEAQRRSESCPTKLVMWSSEGVGNNLIERVKKT
jgi:adenylosuccinate lyase